MTPGDPPAHDSRWLGATELTHAYADGLDPTEVASLLLELAEAEPTNAFCLLDPETTLEQARASADRWRAGEQRGPLDGVPMTIKDLILTRGWPTLRGSNLIRPDSDPWQVDAPAVARLREAGAVLLGKVATPEFGWKGVADSPRTGISTNPWDTSRTCGGSSGGSASAVAQGLGVGSVGTDGGGSVRIPGGFCGVVAFKPTYGRIPLWPASPYGTLAHAGPMTRTVADAAIMLDVLAGPDARDWSALPPPVGSFAEAAGAADVAGLRIAWSPDLGYGVNDPQVLETVQRAVAALADAGAVVEQVDLQLGDPVWAYHTLWFAGALAVVNGYGPGAMERIDPNLADAIARYGHTSSQDYLRAVDCRMALGQRFGALHETYDVLLTPTLPGVAFEAGVDVPAGSAVRDWTSWTPYSYPFNLTQQPAITVPCGVVDGLPVGLQVVGPRHGDATVVRVAAAYEQIGGWEGLGGTTKGSGQG
ncbi:amidase [Naumannella halotolerans]|nr:amidase [Naumannella halotolerans]